MTPAKQAAIEAAGFRVGDAEDFLGLTEDETRTVEAYVAARTIPADPLASRFSIEHRLRRIRDTFASWPRKEPDA